MLDDLAVVIVDRTGILEHARHPSPGSREHSELTAGIKRLTLPGEMGEAIKVMALTADVCAPLSGFALRDLRDRL